MTTRTRNIVGWGLAGVLCLMLAASAADKLAGSEHASKMAASFGIPLATYRVLGGVELASALLFLLPRTGTLGAALLASYMGGAIATHLQHQQDIVFPIGIQAWIWVTAIVRFPELGARLRGVLRA